MGKPQKLTNNVINIPTALKSKYINITLHMDSVVVSGQIFLVSIEKSIHYRDTPVVESKSKKDFYTALDLTLYKYNHAGF